MNEAKKKCVILGAGLCGLTAARELAREGKDVLVLEKEEEAGGLCRTVVRNGCRVDLGSHRFHTDAYRGNARKVIESLDPKMLKVHPRAGLIRFNRSYVPYPPQLYNLVRTFTPAQLWGCFKGFLREKIRPEPAPEEPNFESHIVGKIGRGAYELFYRDAAQKHWFLHPRELSVDEVKKRIETTEPVKVLGETLRGFLGFSAAGKMTFLYPPGGIGRLGQSLLDDYRRAGGELVLNGRPTGLSEGPNGEIESLTFLSGEKEERVLTEAVFSSMPITELADLISGPKPDKVQRSLDQLFWRSLRIFYCRVPLITWYEAETFYFPEMKYPFGRISRPRLFDSSMGGDGPGELLCIELASTQGDETWRETDRDLFERLIPSLQQADLLREGERPYPEEYFSEKESHVYPILHVGWREAFQTVYDWLLSRKNLYSIGRHGLYLHNNIDQTMDLGYRCARHYLQEGPADRRAWDKNIEYWSNLKIKY